MKALLLFVLLPLTAFGTTWEEYLDQKKALVSHERHLPFRLTHGHKTHKSVLLIHGIYSSPLYFKGMANAYFKAGYNVVTILLPGHWEKDFHSMNKVKPEDWIEEADLGFKFATELGDQVILSGHSLGGLLALEQSLKRNERDVHSLVLISPALKVWSAVLLACRAGMATNLTGNNFDRSKPDGKNIPVFSPIAGPLIQKLADRVVKRPVTTPTFMAYTWNDNVVDVRYVDKYFKKLNVAKKVKKFTLFSGISHGDISQAPTDFPTHLNHTNHRFDEMMTGALEFVESLP